MLTFGLAAALLVVVILMVVWRRHLTILMSLGSLIGALLAMIWLQDLGLLPGTKGPFSHTRPQTLEDVRR